MAMSAVSGRAEQQGSMVRSDLIVAGVHLHLIHGLWGRGIAVGGIGWGHGRCHGGARLRSLDATLHGSCDGLVACRSLSNSVFLAEEGGTIALSAYPLPLQRFPCTICLMRRDLPFWSCLTAGPSLTTSRWTNKSSFAYVRPFDIAKPHTTAISRARNPARNVG